MVVYSAEDSLTYPSSDTNTDVEMANASNKTEPGDQLQGSDDPPNPTKLNLKPSKTAHRTDYTIRVGSWKHDDSYKRQDTRGRDLKASYHDLPKREASLSILSASDLSVRLLSASSLSSRGGESPSREPVSTKYIVTSEALCEVQEQLSRDKKAQKATEEKLREKNIQQEAALKGREEELLAKTTYAEDYLKLWKKTGKELERLRALGQRFYQVTDRDLIDPIMQLRYTIRDFAIQYFDHDMMKDKLVFVRPHYGKYLERITPSLVGYDCCYLRSHGKSHQIIQAFLWRVLIEEIFDKFRWMGERASYIFRNLRAQLRPTCFTDSSGRRYPDPEAERKFQMWSATTTGLVLDSIGSAGSDISKQVDRDTRDCVDRIANTIDGGVEPGESRDFDDQLFTIIHQAYAIDKEIGRQVASIEWMPNLPKFGFDPLTMELEEDSGTNHPQNVRFVIAPGVRKWGKSTGEGFNQSVMLLNPIVSCE